MTTEFKFEFPPEVERERETLRDALQKLTEEKTLESIRKAQDLLSAWLKIHPEDYIMWDAGEVLAMLEDALVATQSHHVSAPQS